MRKWEQDASEPATGTPQDNLDADDDGLPAYFALSVAAAGWHSGALVLVNEAKAERIRNHYRASEGSTLGSGVTIPEPASFLGRATQLVSDFVGTSQARDVKKAEWVWEEHHKEFPRLTLKNGEVVPGKGDPLELDDNLRNWKEVELVEL